MNPWNVGMPPTTSGATFAGQPTVGASAGAADYAGVQGFADAANANARRYLDPQQAQDNRQMSQGYSNMGIDPMSAMGQQMSDQLARQHGDQDQGAAFNAMQFGQGIQDQMFNQNFMNTRQAGDMQQASWNNDNNRGQLQLGRQQQDFNEMMGYDSIDFRNAQFNESNNQWDQSLAMQMAGFNSPYYGSQGGQGGNAGGGSQTSPWSNYANDMRGIWNGGG